jgi:hypothetical protein
LINDKVRIALRLALNKWSRPNQSGKESCGGSKKRNSGGFHYEVNGRRANNKE